MHKLMLKIGFCLAFILLLEANTILASNNVTLMSSDVNESVLKFTIEEYDFNEVQTAKGPMLELLVPDTGKMMTKGAPALPKMAASVLIPDSAGMKVDVVSSDFIELHDIDLAPSKGNLTRDVDPDDLPYTFGKQYKKDAFYPKKLARLRTPHIVRDFRGQTVVVHPFMYNPVTKVLRVYTEIVVKVSDTGQTGENVYFRQKALEKTSKRFKDVYSRHFINYDQAKTYYTSCKLLDDDIDNMLIVCYSGFMDEMADFVSWKQSIGYNVELVNYSNIGSSSSLKSYVANYYNNNGLTYLLLVGDHKQVPSSSTSSGDSDNNYGYITGGDKYQDIFVGRFSAENSDQVETQVERTIHYERDLQSSASFFKKAIGSGSSQGPGHNNEMDYEHINNILSDLKGDGYSTSTCHESGGSTSQMTSLINAGAGTIFYAGHGSTTGWASLSYSVSDVNSLSNQNELPFVISVACVVGNFTSSTCFSESWQRATSGGSPTGAIANCGSTINQSWEPPMDAQDEMADLLVKGSVRTFGGMFVNGLFKMIDINGSGGESMADTWVCFGDPSVQMRTPGNPDGPEGGGGPGLYTLKVNSGSGDGSYAAGANVSITASAAPSGEEFDHWVVNSGSPQIANINASSTTLTMPSGDVTVTATYTGGGGGGDYCTSSGDNNSYEWIAGVNIGSLNNTSSASGYSDFTSKTLNASVNDSISVSLNPGFSGGSYTESWKVWIDYNLDGDFEDSGEEVLSKSGSSTVSGSFTVPSSASGATRMRVSMSYDSAPPCCGTFSYGEVEDYTINISGGTQTYTLSVASGSGDGDYEAGENVGITANGAPSGQVFDKWVVNSGSPSIANVNASSTTLTMPSGDVKVTATYKDDGGGGGGEYCTSSGSNNSYEWIACVQVGSLNNKSGASGYTDFTNKTLSVSANETVSVSLTPGYSGDSYPETWRIWIDYNQDGDFEDYGEEVVSKSGGSSVSDSFKVSGTASGVTRMRVSMSYGSVPPCCGTFGYGEVEDYTISIGDGGGGGGGDYCTSSGNTNSYEWIACVQVGSLNNKSGASGYTDFTNKTLSVSANETVSVSLTPGYSGDSYPETWRIWIDYNQDGDFEDYGEEVVSKSGGSSVSDSFKVSGTASGVTRMRVSMSYGSVPPCCGTFSCGEVEDYTVSIGYGVGGDPGDDLSYIVKAVNNGFDTNDLYLMANGLEGLGYEKQQQNMDVSCSGLISYMSSDVDILYHAGHGNVGLIATLNGSVNTNNTTVYGIDDKNGGALVPAYGFISSDNAVEVVNALTGELL